MPRKWIYLTPDDLRHFHEQEVLPHSLLPGINEANLEMAAYRCQTSFGGVEVYPGIHDKAAALFTGVACGHAFVEGNKRVAVVAVDVFYKLNGYRLPVEPGDLIHLAMDVIEHRIPMEKVVDLFERWAVPFTLPDFEDLF